MFSFIKALRNKAARLSTNKNNRPLYPSLELVLQSLHLYRSNFWLMVGYTAWLLFPLSGYFLLSFFPEQNPIIVVFDTLFSVAEFVITFWVGIIFILMVNAITEKQPFDTVGLKNVSLSLLRPTARVFVLHILIVLLGFILLVIPGFVAIVWLAFAQTSVILDGKRGKEALSFSRNLSKGRFFRVLYRLIGGPILIGFVYFLFVAVLISIVGGFSGFDPTQTTQTFQPPAWVDLLESTIGIFVIPLLATYMTLLYKHLKETRDPSAKQETVAGGCFAVQDDKDKITEDGHETTPLQPHS